MRIIEILKQIINPRDIVVVGIGLLFIFLAILIGVFKQHWLIAGVSIAPKEELEKIDLEYIGKYFGISLGTLGFGLFLCPLVFTYFEITKFYDYFLISSVFSFTIFLFVFGAIKKDRIYKKK